MWTKPKASQHLLEENQGNLVKSILKIKLEDEITARSLAVDGLSDLKSEENVISDTPVFEKSRLILANNEREKRSQPNSKNLRNDFKTKIAEIDKIEIRKDGGIGHLRIKNDGSASEGFRERNIGQNILHCLNNFGRDNVPAVGEKSPRKIVKT